VKPRAVDRALNQRDRRQSRSVASGRSGTRWKPRVVRRAWGPKRTCIVLGRCFHSASTATGVRAAHRRATGVPAGGQGGRFRRHPRRLHQRLPEAGVCARVLSGRRAACRLSMQPTPAAAACQHLREAKANGGSPCHGVAAEIRMPADVAACPVTATGDSRHRRSVHRCRRPRQCAAARPRNRRPCWPARGRSRPRRCR
jgi:hypothetical protein